MKKSRLFKAEIIVLLCVAILWAVNLKTHCVPRATVGALRQIVKVAPNSRCAYDLGKAHPQKGNKDLASEEYEVLNGLDEELANDLPELIRNHEDAPKPPEPSPLDQIDPLAILSEQYELVTEMRLAPFDDIEAKVKANIQHQLDTSYQQYRIDVEAIRNSGMPQNQQAQLMNQLNADYQKDWVSMKARRKPEVEAQEARSREIMAELKTDYAERVARLQRIQTMIERDLLDPVAAKREQLRIVGFDLPLSSLNPEKMANLTIGASHPAEGNAGDHTPAVEAIGIAADGRFYAMIGGAFVYEGGIVQGYRVQKIGPDGVEFERDGEIWVQKVN